MTGPEQLRYRNCAHPLADDEQSWDPELLDWATARRCLLCGEDRTAALAGLREAILARRRLPASPWAPGEQEEEEEVERVEPPGGAE